MSGKLPLRTAAERSLGRRLKKTELPADAFLKAFREIGPQREDIPSVQEIRSENAVREWWGQQPSRCCHSEDNWITVTNEHVLCRCGERIRIAPDRSAVQLKTWLEQNPPEIKRRRWWQR